MYSDLPLTRLNLMFLARSQVGSVQSVQAKSGDFLFVLA
jgi:hypothetical protein